MPNRDGGRSLNPDMKKVVSEEGTIGKTLICTLLHVLARMVRQIGRLCLHEYEKEHYRVCVLCPRQS